MKTIGLIGGMSWESTAEYYRIINEAIKEILGELHSAKIVMYSFDFEDIGELQRKRKWDEISITRHASKPVAIVGYHDCTGNPADKKTQLR